MKISKKCTQSLRLQKKARGVVLLEAMISAILLVVGLFGVLKMISSATTTVTDSEFRALAIERSLEILEEMRVAVDRSSMASIRHSLEEFVHQPNGGDCDFSGPESGTDAVRLWRERLKEGVLSKSGTHPETRLPGVTDERMQIVYKEHDNNLVKVTICWQGPNDEVPRRQEMSAHII